MHQSSRQSRPSFQITLCAKGLPTASHRTGRAAFPHPVLQINLGCQFQMSFVRRDSLTQGFQIFRYMRVLPLCARYILLTPSDSLSNLVLLLLAAYDDEEHIGFRSL
jgi:hypothetical protein